MTEPVEAQTIEMEEKSSRIFHKSLFYSYFLVLFILLVITTMVFFSSRRFSCYSREKEQAQLQSLIDEELSSLSSVALEYGWWNEAIEQIFHIQDSEWVAINMVDYLTEAYGASWVLPYDMEGNLFFGKHYDETVESSPLPLFGESVFQLIDETLSSDLEAPSAASGILAIEDELHIVSVMVFAAYEPTELDTSIPHGYLILTRKVDDKLLQEMSSKSGIGKITLTLPHDDPKDLMEKGLQFKKIYNSEGSLAGVLEWSDDPAIDRFFGLILHLAFSMILCIVFISLFFFKNLFNYFRLTKKIISTEKSHNEKLFYKANYDELTGLTNRNLFMDRLNQSIKRCVRNNKSSAMLFIDLDGFKNINDTLGHETGDDLLIQVGKRLSESMRAQDTVSRFGGDEFCIILEDMKTVAHTDIVLSKILQLFERPFPLCGDLHYLGVSMGVVFIPEDGTDSVSLLKFADIAMYQAKKENKSKYIYFNKELDKNAHRRSTVKNGLRQAIENGELTLHYQPIYDLRNRAMNHIEALLRWIHPAQGCISPEEFIPIAEETGIIGELGTWIIDRALRDILEINSRTGSTIHISINVSASQLRDTDFPEHLLSKAAEYEIAPSMIHLELTETVLIDDSILKNGILHKLSDSGFKLVMDDFGTGYSSLSYIQKIPFGSIKIDKSFVSAFKPDNKNGALIKTIVYMANTFDFDTVAEGIETEEQEHFLLQSGSRYGQGYLYSRPIGKSELIQMIDTKSKISDNCDRDEGKTGIKPA